jgi:hypothetical protein
MARPRTVYVGVRILDVDHEWYEKLANLTGKSFSDTIRDSLTAYRALMQSPGVAIFKPVDELRGELVGAYQAGTALQIPNDITVGSASARPRSGSRRGGRRSSRPSAPQDPDAPPP